MPIFIKAGYWEKLRLGLKGYFNLDDYVKTLIANFSLSDDQRDAIDGANSPSASNVFATMADIPSEETIIDGIQFIFGDIVNSKVYQLVTKARYAFTINSIALQTDAGTASVNVKINNTSVTGLSAVGATNSIVDTNATAANSVAIGDIVTLTVSSIVAATSLSGNLKITRV